MFAGGVGVFSFFEERSSFVDRLSSVCTVSVISNCLAWALPPPGNRTWVPGPAVLHQLPPPTEAPHLTRHQPVATTDQTGLPGWSSLLPAKRWLLNFHPEMIYKWGKEKKKKSQNSQEFRNKSNAGLDLSHHGAQVRERVSPQEGRIPLPTHLREESSLTRSPAPPQLSVWKV